MSAIVSYQLTSSDESSSADESETTELLPSKKFCPDQREVMDSTCTENAQEQEEDEDEEEKGQEEQLLPSSETEDEIEQHNEQEDEEIVARQIEGDFSHVTRKQSYALDQKELPGEMATFLCEVKRFFTRPVNLERQAKPLAMATFRKAQERILCESFRKFRENSLNDLIFVVCIYVLTRPFSCLQVS